MPIIVSFGIPSKRAACTTAAKPTKDGLDETKYDSETAVSVNVVAVIIILFDIVSMTLSGNNAIIKRQYLIAVGAWTSQFNA
jgi:hypothetical protein